MCILSAMTTGRQPTARASKRRNDVGESPPGHRHTWALMVWALGLRGWDFGNSPDGNVHHRKLRVVNETHKDGRLAADSSRFFPPKLQTPTPEHQRAHAQREAPTADSLSLFAVSLSSAAIGYLRFFILTLTLAKSTPGPAMGYKHASMNGCNMHP